MIKNFIVKMKNKIKIPILRIKQLSNNLQMLLKIASKTK